jgi:hypothetical protein
MSDCLCSNLVCPFFEIGFGNSVHMRNSSSSTLPLKIPSFLAIISFSLQIVVESRSVAEFEIDGKYIMSHITAISVFLPD